MIKIVHLLLGGALGTLARYGLSGAVYRMAGTSFPYGTLVVNLTGCLFIGFLAVVSEEKFLLSPSLRLLLMVGFCGAFTTFSTFMLETAELMRSGQSWQAFANMAWSMVAGFVCFRAGVFFAEII